MRKFFKDEHANVREIGMVVGLLVTIAIAILVFYSIAASFDTAAVDNQFGGVQYTPAVNATNATLGQASTFFTIAPIIAIVVVAVIILGYVGSIGGGRTE